MFAAADGFQLDELVLLETYLGDGARGPKYAVGFNITCFVEDSRRLVRASSGEEVISETTLYTDLANANDISPDSKVTVNGRTALVLLVKRHVIGDPDVDHLEVVLT